MTDYEALVEKYTDVFLKYSKVVDEIVQLREEKHKLMVALRRCKQAIWCENVDEENAAYEEANELLKAFAKKDGG